MNWYKISSSLNKKMLREFLRPSSDIKAPKIMKKPSNPFPKGFSKIKEYLKNDNTNNDFIYSLENIPKDQIDFNGFW